MNKLFILALIPLIIGCKTFQKEIVIPRDTIQSAIDKKFPFDRSMIVMRITLMEPKIYFKETNIGINLRYWGSYLEKEIEGKIDLNGHIRYEKGAFYMDSLQLVEATLNEKEFSSDGKFQKILVNLIKNYLECFPLYKLKQSDIKQNLARLLLRDISVDGDSLKIIIGL
jgi:hypothetical protein